jgi:hypothetical protein
MAEGLSGGVICRGGSGSSLVGRGGRVDASGEESAGSDGAGESTVYLQETESVDFFFFFFFFFFFVGGPVGLRGLGVE